MAASILPDEIITSIPVTPETKTIWTGYSGGMDSHVLLHLLSKFRSRLDAKIVAIHVNHGLNSCADDWSRHCQKVCIALGIDFHLLSIDATCPGGESPEAWARQLRYQAILELVGDGDIFLTAHHKDDMAETLLLQLFRGAGPAGLAAMPATTRFGRGWHCRPLLTLTKSELVDLAVELDLPWIEDDSNLNNNFDRNYLRHNLIPVIKERWPAMAHTLTRSARLQAESSQLLEELAEIDLLNCKDKKTSFLNIPALISLSRARAANVIRFWIKTQAYPTPTAAQLSRVFEDVIMAQANTVPCVSWDGVELRRYRDSLFIIRQLPDISADQNNMVWQLDNECSVIIGSLSASLGKGNGIKVDKCPDRSVIVKYRRGSEKIKKGGHHHQLKKLYQESGVPSCFRDYIPLLYIDDKLVAISGMYIDEDFAAGASEDAFQIHWTGADEVFALSHR